MPRPLEPAVAHVQARAEARTRTDVERIAAVLGKEPGPRWLNTVMRGLYSHARLTLNFHPDRRMANRKSVAAGLLETGQYRPQSLTGLSNGGRFALGGARSKWERKLFGEAYVDDSVRKPVYGALDLTHDPFGGSPRFGSCYVIIAGEWCERTTFCIGDSHVGPSDIGTVSAGAGLLAGLFEAAANGDALARGLDVHRFAACLTDGHRASEPARDLDHYIEAQVHGPVDLKTQVEAIVLDPSFRDSETHALLSEAAGVYNFELRWHQGSQLHVSDIPDAFRGPDMRPLAARIVGADGMLDAAAIGRSAAEIPFSPPSPEGDLPDSALQQHKRLWHCVLRFGQ